MARDRALAIRITRLLAAFTLAFTGVLIPAAARGDAGQVRLTVNTPTLIISFFTESTPRVGLVDVNMVVQPIPPGARRSPPACEMWAYRDGSPEKKIHAPAISARAMNTPMRVAQLEMNEPGIWHVDVTVLADGEQAINNRFDLTVDDGYGGATGTIAWVGLPVIGVWLYVLHRRRVRSRQRAAAVPASPPS
jgi:hypothetical protein